MSVAPRLTPNQAQCLDALRHGGTLDDIKTATGWHGFRAAGMARGLISKGLILESNEHQPVTYTLTATGKAAWLRSMK